MKDGKSIRLFLADGTPGGLLTAEIMNWTGLVVAAPRSDLAALLKRPEVSRTGIYILLGDDPKSLGGTIAYIGEGDDVSKRLYEHARPANKFGKDFWDRAIVLTSKDTNLTKAHVRYLESRLITLAQQASRAMLTNGTTPAPLPLPEADISDMEYFISQAQIVLPVLGVNLLRAAFTAAVPDLHDGPIVTPNLSQLSPIFELLVKKAGVAATAQEIDGEFTVFEGSITRLKWQGRDDGYKRLREKLEVDGTLAVTDDGNSRRFTRNQVFSSPSAAAATAAGRAANGRVEWKVQGSGDSYGDWQSKAIDRAFKEVAS